MLLYVRLLCAAKLYSQFREVLAYQPFLIKFVLIKLVLSFCCSMSGSYLHTLWDFGGSEYQGFHSTSTPPFSQSMGGMEVEK